MDNSAAVFGRIVPSKKMAATVRSETELKRDAKKQLQIAKDPMDKLRLQCLSRGCSGIKGLSRMFRIIDDDGNRKLDFNEFSKGMHDYGVSLPKDEQKAIFMALDRDNSGTIDFDEFLVAIRPAMSQSRQNVVMQAFKKLDKTGDGVIKVEDMEGVYDVTRHPKYLNGQLSKEEIFKKFLATFEANDHPDGMVTRDEFFNYYAGVSASIDNDAAFDLMMRNAWKL